MKNEHHRPTKVRKEQTAKRKTLTGEGDDSKLKNIPPGEDFDIRSDDTLKDAGIESHTFIFGRLKKRHCVHHYTVLTLYSDGRWNSDSKLENQSRSKRVEFGASVKFYYKTGQEISVTWSGLLFANVPRASKKKNKPFNVARNGLERGMAAGVFKLIAREDTSELTVTFELDVRRTRTTHSKRS